MSYEQQSYEFWSTISGPQVHSIELLTNLITQNRSVLFDLLHSMNLNLRRLHELSSVEYLLSINLIKRRSELDLIQALILLTGEQRDCEGVLSHRERVT